MRIPLFPVKLGAVVCLPVLVCLAFGQTALTRVKALADQAATLKNARLPRADFAAAAERRVLLTAQAIRSYALSGDRDALERAKKELAEAADVLHRAKDAAAGQPGTTAEADKIAALLDAYKKAAEAAVGANEAVTADRAELARTTTAFAAAAAAYTEWKTAVLDKELAAKYPNPETLRTLNRKLRAMATATAAGQAIREAADASRISRDPGPLKEAVDGFDGIEAALREIKGQAADEESRRLLPAFEALTACRAAVSALLADWDALRALGRKLLEAEGAVLSAAAATDTASKNETAADVDALAHGLARAGLTLSVAAWAGTAVGLAFAVIAVLWLARPILLCAGYARDLVMGRWHRTLSVTGKDEVGGLAESLKELARRMGRSTAR